MIRRLLFVVFFCLGGFLFYIPKWILIARREVGIARRSSSYRSRL